MEEVYKKWIIQLEELNDNDKEKMIDLENFLKEHTTELYKLVHAINKNENTRIEQLGYWEDGKDKYFKFDEKTVGFSGDNAIEFLGKIIGLTQKYLPMGSVVELLNDTSNIPIKFMIINRLVSLDNNSLFFDYAGIIYPVGIQEKGMSFNFTNGKISRIIVRGYEDIQERMYISLMLDELLLTKGKLPYGVGSKEERTKFEEVIRGE